MAKPCGCPTQGSRRHLECGRAPSLAALVPRYPTVTVAVAAAGGEGGAAVAPVSAGEAGAGAVGGRGPV